MNFVAWEPPVKVFSMTLGRPYPPMLDFSIPQKFSPRNGRSHQSPKVSCYMVIGGGGETERDDMRMRNWHTCILYHDNSSHELFTMWKRERKEGEAERERDRDRQRERERWMRQREREIKRAKRTTPVLFYLLLMWLATTWGKLKLVNLIAVFGLDLL